MKKSFFAVLLVAGTCIGGGTLALPVETAQSGYIPSLVIFFACWMVMAATGLLYLEATLWMEGDTNIISMATATLGNFGRTAAWILYLMLFYCLTIAYMDGCGNLVLNFLNYQIPDWSGALIFTVLFAPFIFSGARLVSWINAIFMIGLGVTYFTFIFYGIGDIEPSFLVRTDWSAVSHALPVALLSFGFQGIVPTLARYLEFNARKGTRAILLGSFLPFFAYALWQALILGILPVEILNTALANGENAVAPLRFFLNKPWITTLGTWFAFFALTTSFFGVTLGLRDFLADGLEIEKDKRGKFFLCFLIFVPPLLVTATWPRLFIKALDWAGLWGATLLLGLLPIMIVYSGRYVLRLPGKRLLGGGKPVLYLIAIFLLFVLFYHPNLR